MNFRGESDQQKLQGYGGYVTFDSRLEKVKVLALGEGCPVLQSSGIRFE